MSLDVFLALDIFLNWAFFFWEAASGEDIQKRKLPSPKKKICGIFINLYTRINSCLNLTKNNNIRHLNCSTVIASRESSNRLGFFLLGSKNTEEIQKSKKASKKENMRSGFNLME
jgi:hypothetical protein